MDREIKRVLVVDDEPEFARTLRRHLRRKGFLMDCAFDGKEACGKIQDQFQKQTPFDLVVTDMVMPKMGGIPLLKWIQESHPEIPVILITAYGGGGVAPQVIRPEMDQYGRKPLTPNEMLDLIEKAKGMRRNASHSSHGRNATNED